MPNIGRTYDPALVDAIEEKSYTVDYEGLEEEIRAIPDDDRDHVLDPRFLDIAQKKLRGEIPSSSAGGVLFQRHFVKDNRLFHDSDVKKTDLVADFGDRGIPLTIFTPEDAAAGAPVLVFLHGGGFTGGWVGHYEAFLSKLCELSGAVIVFPEVRLAPEAPYPAQVDDSEATINWVIAHADELGVDARRMAVAGDSAGGSLTNAAVLRCHDKLKLAFPIYAAVDITENPSYWSYDLYPADPSQEVECRARVDNIKGWDSSDYVRGDAELRKNPEISALFAEDVSFFPRTVVVCSEYDYLRVQNEMFAKKLADADVDVRLVRYKGCDHGFIEIAGTVPQAEDLARLMAEELKAHL